MIRRPRRWRRVGDRGRPRAAPCPRSTSSSGWRCPRAPCPRRSGRLRDQSNLSEAVILSTCLRTEVYAVVERFHDGVAELQEFLATISGSPVDSLDRAPHRALRRRRHQPPVHRGRRARLGGARRVRGARAGPPGLGEGTAASRCRVRCSARSSATRSRPASGSGRRRPSPGASPRCPTGRWPWPPAAGPAGWPGPGSWWWGRARWAKGWPRPWPARTSASLVVANRTAERTEAVVAGLPADAAGRVSAASLDDLGELLASPTWSSPRWAPPTRHRPLHARDGRGRPHGPDAPLLVVDLGVPRNVEPSAGDARRRGAVGHGRAAGRGRRRPVRAARRRWPGPPAS